MASLNLSTNGPSIKSNYQSVINSTIPNGASPTFAQWALFAVQAPLLNAFQDTGSKESVLRVESKGGACPEAYSPPTSPHWAMNTDDPNFLN